MDRLRCLRVPQPQFMRALLKKKRVKLFLEHSLYVVILAVLIPGFFYFELFIVLPAVVEEGIWPIIHITCALFLLSNIVGNMLYGMFTNTSIRGQLLQCENDAPGWSMCAVCETVKPPRSWHCDICNICILKRDHHCSFFACCVGYYNYRYFLMFVLYIFVAMVYSFIFNVKFVAKVVSWNRGFVLVKFILPLAHFAWDYNSDENVYIFLIVINIIVALFTGFLFVYHMMNVVRGRTAGENASKHIDVKKKYDFGLRTNLVDVFGQQWYFTWISPFIKSHLPGNGITWNEKSRIKLRWEWNH